MNAKIMNSNSRIGLMRLNMNMKREGYYDYMLRRYREDQAKSSQPQNDVVTLFNRIETLEKRVEELEKRT